MFGADGVEQLSAWAVPQIGVATNTGHDLDRIGERNVLCCLAPKLDHYLGVMAESASGFGEFDSRFLPGDELRSDVSFQRLQSGGDCGLAHM